ncbi:hypothetical protein ACU5Y9_004454, partial [Salmonella enterica subsp. enterica serovar Anatum]
LYVLLLSHYDDMSINKIAQRHTFSGEKENNRRNGLIYAASISSGGLPFEVISMTINPTRD